MNLKGNRGGEPKSQPFLPEAPISAIVILKGYPYKPCSEVATRKQRRRQGQVVSTESPSATTNLLRKILRRHPFSRDAERSASRQPIPFLYLTWKNALRYEFVGRVGIWGDDFSRRILRVAAKRWYLGRRFLATNSPRRG